jgi:E3 ubiquitin-protein ligase RNF14
MPRPESEPTEQEEELLALQAIFPEELTLRTGTPDTVHFELSITSSVPVMIQLPRSSLMDIFSKAEQATATIFHFPPLYMEFQLPVGYPTESPPMVRLKTYHDWLPDLKLKELEREIIRLWEEAGRTAIIFSYISHLQEASNDIFGLLGSDLNNSGTTTTVLVDYDKSTTRRIFEQSTFTCGICLEVLKGSACHQLQHCAHVFCISCLQECYSSAIKEGNIKTVKCLEPGCEKGKKLLGPKELLQIHIERVAIKRYYDLRRKKLMGKDPETVWCPRPWCSGAAKSTKYPVIQIHAVEKTQEIWEGYDVIEEKKDDRGFVDTNMTGADSEPPPLKTSELIVCERCTFAFCSVCMISWHGPYGRCNAPRTASELAQEELKSKIAIQHCLRCPCCDAPYEKISGCSHLRCANCDAEFCDMCHTKLLPGTIVHEETESASCPKRRGNILTRG